MKYGIYFSTYENEIYIYRIYDDKSKIKILKFYEKNNNIYFNIEAKNFKYFIGFNEFIELMEMDMNGINMKLLYENLLDIGILNICEKGELL